LDSQCNDSNVCTTDTCNGGICAHTNNTMNCDDSNLCTTGDACSGGSCAGAAVDCDDSNLCTTDSCVPATGCVHTAITCNDGNACTDDTCVPAAGCVFTNNTNTCSDGNACTTGDVCSGGSCQPGSVPLDCDDSNLCTTDSCVPATGCVHTATTCTGGQVCDPADGVCKACTLDSQCNDSNVCTTDTCNAGACVNTNNTVSCDDSNLCTTGDVCANGSCGTAVSCQAGESCDPADGICKSNNNSPYSPDLVSPTDGQTGLGTTVEFRWKKTTDADGDAVTYKISYCTTPNATNCTPVTVASRSSKGMFYAGGAGLLMIGMTFFGGFTGRKRTILLLLIVVLFTGGTLMSCSKSTNETTAPNTLPGNQVSYTASGLSADTTYYWKVTADDGKGGTTDSAVWNFKTQ
jgi:hypothetical protein